MFKPSDFNPKGYPTTPEIEANLKDLCDKINVLRLWYSYPVSITSGLRSQAQQDALIKAGKSKASKSKHLTGQAVDLADADGKLKAWAGENLELMAELELWMEDFGSTPTWVHFQIVPPASGARVFKP